MREGIFENFIKMANVLIPVKFQFRTLYGGLISISGISPISTKKQIWYLEVMVFKRIQNFFWYFLLHERNNTNKFRKITITTGVKQAPAKSFILTFSAAMQA